MKVKEAIIDIFSSLNKIKIDASVKLAERNPDQLPLPTVQDYLTPKGDIK